MTIKHESFLTHNPKTKTVSVIRVNHSDNRVTLKVISENWKNVMHNSKRINRQQRKRIITRFQEMDYTIERS